MYGHLLLLLFAMGFLEDHDTVDLDPVEPSGGGSDRRRRTVFLRQRSR